MVDGRKNDPGHKCIFIKMEEITFLAIKLKLILRSSPLAHLCGAYLRCVYFTRNFTLYSSLMTSYFVYGSELKNKSFAAFF